MLGIAGVPAVLIMLQPDLGTMLVLSATVFGVLAVVGGAAALAGRRCSLAGAAVAAMASWRGVLKQYQVNRFMAFTDPTLDPRGAGYNTTQARIAIGNGGLFGPGLFDGSQTRSRFVPEQHTDFIFTVAGEELGLVGAGVLIALFAVLIWRALWISRHAETCSAGWPRPASPAGSRSRPSRTSACAWASCRSPACRSRWCRTAARRCSPR